MGFNVRITTSVNTEGNGVMLLPPGIYDGFVQKIEKEVIKTKKDEEKTCLTITINCGNKGFHKHTIWPLEISETEEDFEKKVNNFIIKCFAFPNAMFGKENVVTEKHPLDADNAQDVFDFVIRRCEELGNFAKVGDYSKFPVRFKITGQLNLKGEPTASIPPYGGSVVKAGEALSFGRSEAKGNADYEAALTKKTKAKSENTSEAGSSSSDDDDMPF